MYLFDTYKQIEIGKSIFLKDHLSFLFNSLEKQNILNKKGYEYIKSQTNSFENENIEEQSNITDSNQILFDRLLSIKEYLKKLKENNIDNMNSGEVFSYENIFKLAKEINPTYQDVIMINN